MEKPFPDDQFLARWLNDELTEEELHQLKQREDYDTLQRIIAAAGDMEVPDFSEAKAWEELKKRRDAMEQTAKVLPLRKRWVIIGGIAASIAILLIAYFAFFAGGTLYETTVGEQLTVYLPDSSRVVLNADSRLMVNERNWEEERIMELNGEAFFDVTPGQPFRVTTNNGTIEVLGTRFNVRDREEHFEVDCFSGRVSVAYQDTSAMLSSGEKASNLDSGAFLKERFLPPAAPSWTRGESRFQDRPIELVLDELERQYDISVEYNGETGKIVTVGFPHNNLEAALQLVSGVADLTYTVNGSTVVFSPE